MTTQTTRRAALVGAAALPAMSLPAIAAPDPVFAATVASDPIFEKVVKYKAAWDGLKGHTDEPADANGRLASNTPEYKIWEEKEGELGELLSEAEDDLISTQPRTRSGAAVMVEAYLSVNRGDLEFGGAELPLLENLLAYLQSNS